MKSLLLIFYRIFFMPFGTVLILLISPFHKKIREGITLRKNQKIKDHPPAQRPIWFHCSSGEFEYAKSIIRELKLKSPHIPILVTYFSPSYRKNVESSADVDMATAAPWDFPGPIFQFIKHHQPRALLVARTDLWPEMLTQCKRLNIPRLLFSCSKRAPRWYQFLPKLYANWVYSLVDKIFVVSEVDKSNLLAWAPHSQVEVRGDTRYDQVSARLMNPKPIKDSLFQHFVGLTLVCGSTWEEDEEHLMQLLPLVEQGLLRMVLVPHEPGPSHLRALETLIHIRKGKSIRYSKAQTWDPSEILIVDQVGILAELYIQADLAFVGGSFKSTVHSVMEPLGARVITFVGPYHKNNREACEFQLVSIGDGISGVTAVQSGNELNLHIQHLLENRGMVKEAQTIIRKELFKKEGASQWVLDWLEKHTDDSPD